MSSTLTSTTLVWTDDDDHSGSVTIDLSGYMLRPVPEDAVAMLHTPAPGGGVRDGDNGVFVDRQQAAALAGLLAGAAGVHFATISDHDGTPVSWVCDECGQPLAEGGRCSSGLHVGPHGSGFRGMAVASTDLVAERNQLRERVAELEQQLAVSRPAPCARCGNLPPGEASGAADLCTCPPDTGGS